MFKNFKFWLLTHFCKVYAVEYTTHGKHIQTAFVVYKPWESFNYDDTVHTVIRDLRLKSGQVKIHSVHRV